MNKPPAKPGLASLLPYVLVAVAGVLIFLPNVADPLVSDDYVAVEALAAQPLGPVLSGVNLGGGAFFRPLTLSWLWAETRLFGTSAFGFHVAHLLLGGLVAVVVFGLFGALFGRTTAYLATAAFVVAPAHVENLAWISGVADVLAATLLLAALWVHVRARQLERPRLLAVAALLFALALTAKEIALVGPLLVLLVDRHVTPAPRRRQTALAAGVWLGIALVWLGVRTAVLGGLGGYGMVHLRIGAFVVRDLVRYAQLFFVPAGFEEQIPWVMANRFIVFPVLAVAAAAAAWFGRRLCLRPAVRLGLAGGLVSLLPVANLFPRRLHLFLASAWFALAVGGVVVAVWESPSARRRRWATVALAAWLVVCLGLVAQQSHRWRCAAQLAATVVADLASGAGPDGMALVLTVPDTLRGAFVMRNGLHQALRLAAPEKNVVVHHLLLAGLNDELGTGLTWERTNANAWLVRHDGASMHDYLLPPDAGRDLRAGDARDYGPSGLRAVDSVRPFALSSVEVSIDPAIVAAPSTKVFVFRDGHLMSLAEGANP